jgi:hypothetical protein
MLTLGHSVVHSRMPLADTKRISQFLKARPLAGASIRYTPIYTNDGWHTLYCIRIQTFVLSILCYMEVPLSSINHQINLFETALTQSRIDLPAEVCLSHFSFSNLIEFDIYRKRQSCCEHL